MSAIPPVDPARWPPRVRELRIDDVRIDLPRRRVQRPDGESELPQRMFDLLLLLAAEPHRLHSRSELLRRVWDGVIVEDANLSQSVWMLRKALGESRKHWIRTVSKKGYAFEPPADVVAGPPEVITDAPVAMSANARPAPVATVPRRRGRRLAWLAATATLALAAGSLAAWQLRHDDAATIPASVTLIDVEDPGAGPAARMPARLLNAWLGWKLSALPQITVLTPAQLAADASAKANNTVILLSSARSPQTPALVRLSARFEDAGGPQHLQVSGPPKELAALVDALSQQVLAHFAPEQAQQQWPQLKVSPAAALRFADMVQAQRERDWVRAVEIGRELTAAAPDFSLGQLELASTLGRLGQLPAARGHLRIAQRLLQPLPPEAAARFHAYALGLSPQHAEAADAYAALAKRYPRRSVFVLEQARALGRTGRFADALALLSGPRWEAPMPVALRVRQLLARSGFEQALGEIDAAQTSAVRADRLASAAGEGWAYERGHTLLRLGEIDGAVAAGTRSSPQFEAAAQQFELAGDEFSALRARFLGETLGPYQGSSKHLDAWLAQARAAGQQQLELSALRAKAFQHFRAGNLGEYRAYLQQAIAVAGTETETETETSDDTWSLAAMQLDLLHEDFLRADHARMDERLRELRQLDVQGGMRAWVDQFAALLAFNRGEHRAALQALQHGEAQVRAGRQPDAPEPAIIGMYACVRGGLALTQGQSNRARDQYQRCAKTGPIEALQAQYGIAEIDLLSGDRDAALQAVDKLLDALPDVATLPSRWAFTVDVASLLVQAGDGDTATKLYRKVLPDIIAADYAFLEAHARMGLAEIALARGDSEAARRQLRGVRSLLPADHWALLQRVRLAEIAIAEPGTDTTQALIALDEEAHRRGDAVAQLRVHSLMPPELVGAECTAAQRAALVARTGLRAATTEHLARDGAALFADADSAH